MSLPYLADFRKRVLATLEVRLRPAASDGCCSAPGEAMLTNVTISVAELANLKPVHCKVLAGLLAFADRFGKCWPSQRTLAAVVGLKLSPLNRAIAEMESAGIFTRTRRGVGTLYQLAERFLWQAIRPKPAERPEPDCSASGTLSSASGTEGEAKKEIQDLKTKRGSVRLAPPPAASPAEPAPKPAARPVEGPNPFARRQWLRKLNTYVGEHLSGSLQWSGWEVVSKALNGDMLDRPEQRLLDRIDAAMRGMPGFVLRSGGAIDEYTVHRSRAATPEICLEFTGAVRSYPSS